MSQTYEKYLVGKLEKVSQDAKAAAEAMEAEFKESGEVKSETKEKFDKLCEEGAKLRESLESLKGLSSIEDFLNAPEKKRNPEIGDAPRIVSLGDEFVNSELYKNTLKAGRRPQGTNVSVNVKGVLRAAERKATVTTATTGQETYINYVGNMGAPVMIEQQRLTIVDLLAQGQTTLNSIPYIRENSFTNAADTVAEEGEKPEAAFDLTDEFAPVKKIAVIARVTDEMWNDFPTLRDYINNRLRFMVEAKEEQQLLNGAGTGSQITGILNTSGIQTQALGGDTVADAIHKAITKIRSVGFFEPDGLVIHPNDWETLRLLKDSNNQYYGGGPFTGAYGNGGMAPNKLWGLPVVITTAIAENTALVGAFRLGAQVFYREGVTVEATNSHEDDFQYNRMALRVEERLALAVYRPKAFCTVTGI